MKENRVSIPFNGKVKIDFDAEKRVFFLSAIIFDSCSMPPSIKSYVEARDGHSFKPYKTSFRVVDSCVFLIQEIPFQWGFQPSFRGQVQAFRKLARGCYQTLLEIAVEEKVQIVEESLFSMLLN